MSITRRYPQKIVKKIHREPCRTAPVNPLLYSKDVEEQQRTENQEELVSKTLGTSIVWVYFGFKTSDVDHKTALCE